jgi:YidC/Oxa1 family membrane protein insertase
MFHTFFYEPVYNLIVLILGLVPLHDIGTTIVLVTLLVKGILLPLNLSALRSQYIMKRLEKEMAGLKEKHKDNPQEAGKHIMELYKREKVNPFASIFTMVIQIPVFFALYFVFSKGLFADPNSLYSFVHFPEVLHTKAFGIFDVTQRNIVIAILAGLSSYVLARRQTSSMVSSKKPEDETMQDQLMKSMRVQLLYVLPIIIAFSGSVLPAALSLYWLTSNIVSYLQDMYMKAKLKHLHTI